MRFLTGQPFSRLCLTLRVVHPVVAQRMAKRVFITAAEVSGDLHASHLIRSLRELNPGLLIEGHGGPAMREAGATIHTETTGDAAMGFSALTRVRGMFSLLSLTRWCFHQTA